jgi:hypothetical protein
MKLTEKSTGLGDTIAKFTHFFFIDKLAHWFAVKVLGKQDCGCERRRQSLNKTISYSRKSLLD